MRNFFSMKYLTISLIFIISSCVTINIYFPAAAVEKAADRIVEEVWGEKEIEQEEPKKEGEPQSFIERSIRFILMAIGPEEAFAQEADINITTPAIRAVKESIKKRADSIRPYLDRGNLGINNDGLLVLRSNTGLKLKEEASLNRLIKAENSDRNTLYKEIARANNFPPDRISDIKKIFARSWIKQANKGWWVQDPEGKWIRQE